jgi:hypothetical protein
MAHHYHVSKEEIDTHRGMTILKDQSPGALYTTARLNGRQFLCNTSEWDQRHLNALRVIEFDKFPIERLCPVEYIVSRDSPLGQQVVEHFSLSFEDLRAWRYKQFAATTQFYNELATLTSTDTQALSLSGRNPRKSSFTGES